VTAEPVPVAIRPAIAADADALAELIRALARYERLEHEVKMALLAEAGGEPVGMALFFSNYSTFLGRPGLYLEDLFVKPEHRGRGLGKALLQEVARIALERGCGRLEWAVLDWNRPAIDFYEKLGARPNSGWTTYRLSGEPLHRLGGLDPAT
jgi:GNAT superfamily N-acetyltransferase